MALTLKNILGFSDFLDRGKLIEYINDEYGIYIENNKILLIFRSPSQKTYVAKTSNEFLIINDNSGDVVLASRNLISDMFIEFIDDFDDDYNYKIKFAGVIDWILASKNLFLSREDLKNKIERI